MDLYAYTSTSLTTVVVKHCKLLFPLWLRYAANSKAGRRALRPLAGGFYGVVWGILGDLDYFCKVLLLPRSTLASGPCALCRCKGHGALSWCDFRPTAAWRGEQWDAAAWRMWEGRSPCSLFDLPGFSPWILALDWMHCKYLGHDQFVFGAVLALLCKWVLPREPLQNLQTVWADLCDAYKRDETPVRYRYLNKMTMFIRKSGYPKLRGKAAEVKWLAGPLREVWEKHHNPNLRVHRELLLYLKLNEQVEEMLMTHKTEVKFPEGEAPKFEETVTNMLLLLTRIAEHFLVEKLCNLTQKAHFLQHIAMLVRFLNPRLLWCFMGEDMQKRMACLGRTCVKGQRPGQTISKMLGRYRLALHMRFEKHGWKESFSWNGGEHTWFVWLIIMWTYFGTTSQILF